MNPETLAYVRRVYEGSSGDLTKGLYERLEAIGPVGFVAANLFRAQKCSERAKGYRRHKSDAYGRKQWAMDNLAKALSEHGQTLGLRWGWKEDPAQSFHNQVLYVDLPCGQMSFHTDARGAGPDYPGEWDGVKGACAGRIVQWCATLLDDSAPGLRRKAGVS